MLPFIVVSRWLLLQGIVISVAVMFICAFRRMINCTMIHLEFTHYILWGFARCMTWIKYGLAYILSIVTNSHYRILFNYSNIIIMLLLLIVMYKGREILINHRYSFYTLWGGQRCFTSKAIECVIWHILPRITHIIWRSHCTTAWIISLTWSSTSRAVLRDMRTLLINKDWVLAISCNTLIPHRVRITCINVSTIIYIGS